MKKIKFDKEKPGEPFYFYTKSFWFQTCCDCRLRHIWYLKVIRGKKPDKDIIELVGERDEKGTELRRWYEKKIKGKEK